MTCWRGECRTGCYYPTVCSEAKRSLCPACDWPLDSAVHHAECIAPLDQIGGE